MASTDDAMEVEPRCRGFRSIEVIQVGAPKDSPRSKRRSVASSVDGAQRHRAVTDGAAEATESGAHHVATPSKRDGSWGQPQ